MCPPCGPSRTPRGRRWRPAPPARAGTASTRAAPRESGSGTRNGFLNSLGLAPSWGVGDNVGGVDGVGGSVLAPEHLLGPDFVPCNKIGSGDIENTVINHRLSVGFTGAERAVN